jgi:hypothetical protein
VEYPLVGNLFGLKDYFTDMKALTMIVVQQSSSPEVGEVCIGQGFLPLLPLIKPLLEWEDSSHDEAKNHRPTKTSYQRVLPLLSIDHESRACKRVGDIRIEGVIRVRDDVYLSASHSTPHTNTTSTTTTTTSPNLNDTASVLASVASRGNVPDRLNSTSQYKEMVVESTVPKAKPQYKEPTALCAPENVTTKDDQFVNSVQEGKLDNESWKSLLLVDTSNSILNNFEVEEISSCTSTEDDSILLAAMSGKRQLDYKRSKINQKYLRKRPRLDDDSSVCSIDTENDINLSPATLDYTRSNIESIGDVSFPLLIDRVCREKVRKVQFVKLSIKGINLHSPIENLISNELGPPCNGTTNFFIKFDAPPLILVPDQQGMDSCIPVFEDVTMKRSRDITRNKNMKSYKVKKSFLTGFHDISFTTNWCISFRSDEDIEVWLESKLHFSLIVKKERGRPKKTKMSANPCNLSSGSMEIEVLKATLDLDEVLLSKYLNLNTMVGLQVIKNSKDPHSPIGEIHVQISLLQGWQNGSNKEQKCIETRNVSLDEGLLEDTLILDFLKNNDCNQEPSSKGNFDSNVDVITMKTQATGW